MADVTRDPRAYELMTVFVPELSDEELVEQVERVSRYITDQNGSITEVLRESPWGRRRLAYTIRFNGVDYRDGVYVVFHFDNMPSRVIEIERELKLDVRIIRYLLVHDDPLAGEKVQPGAEVETTEGAEAADEAPGITQAPAAEATTEAASEEPAPEDAVTKEPAGEEMPLEDAPAEETSVEDAQAVEAPTEEAPAEETPVEGAPADETAAAETPVEDAPAVEAPAEEAPAEEAPVAEEEEVADVAPSDKTVSEQSTADETVPAEKETKED